jgi:HPt (histidine-containing phosphotransfer) domain-containing protein
MDGVMTEFVKQPLMDSPPIAADEPPIDIAHLTRMTLGDRRLENQILELFDRQAELLLERMRAVAPAGIATLAHTLGGSARGIGAWRVATAAEALERVAREGADHAVALARLNIAVEEARLAACGLLRISAIV